MPIDIRKYLEIAVKPAIVAAIRLVVELGPLSRLIRNWHYPFRYLRECALFVRDMRAYRRMEGAEPIRFADLSPVFFQRNASVNVDPQYFHAHIWTLSRLLNTPPAEHVDVASSYAFVGLLTCLTRVRYVEFNPPAVVPKNMEVIEGSLLDLPFADGQVASLSCLHAAEHVGLGRYGDPLDPHGTRKAAAELARILAPGGNLFFGVPIGRPRVQFNGQRVHAASQIVSYFPGLDLTEYSGVLDGGAYVENIALDALDDCFGGCGLFWFRKPESAV